MFLVFKLFYNKVKFNKYRALSMVILHKYYAKYTKISCCIHFFSKHKHQS